MKTATAFILPFAMSIYTIAASVDDAFLARLSAVESGGNDAAYNAAEDAHGRYQIRQCYLDDANFLLGTSYSLQDMHDPAKAAEVVRAYLLRYGQSYEHRTGLPATPDVLARIHNGGPRGAERASTLGYASRFSRSTPNG